MKPIIFSTEMVRAILDDRKTMTRRVIKPQPDGVTVDGIAYRHVTREFVDKINGKLLRLTHGRNGDPFAEKIKLPYQPGDLLWVRETFRLFDDGDLYYKADHGDSIPVHADDDPDKWKWTSPLFMPKKCARIFLRVGAVRAERLQDIRLDEPEKEGCPYIYEASIPFQRLIGQSFQATWDRPNTRRGYGWDANPWVWVVEFERTTTEVADSK